MRPGLRPQKKEGVRRYRPGDAKPLYPKKSNGSRILAVYRPSMTEMEPATKQRSDVALSSSLQKYNDRCP